MGLFDRNSEDGSDKSVKAKAEKFRERFDKFGPAAISLSEITGDSDSTGDDRSFRERVEEIKKERASGEHESSAGLQKEKFTIRIEDFHDIDKEVKESGAKMIIGGGKLYFNGKNNIFGNPSFSFSIPTERIDFQDAEIWTREDHVRENFHRVLDGEDSALKGERTFVKLPIIDGGYLTISAGNGWLESNPNEILREFRDICGAQLENREARSPPSQSEGGQDPLEQLERLKQLRDEEVITEKEFEDKKQKLLDRI